MRSQTSILALEWMPVSVAGGVRKAVGGFLRYIEFRDQHRDARGRNGFEAYMHYVAHRDRTSPRGRIFGRDGTLTDGDRRRLVEFVSRSTKGLQPMWRTNRDGQLEDHQRAVYQMIISPEDWRGLDLRRIAQVAMRQLEDDAGEKGVGPWFAAEHWNTKHHHVHVVLAARRELAPGKYSTLLITRRRLQRMKDAMALDISRQRGVDKQAPSFELAPTREQTAQAPEIELQPVRHRPAAWSWKPAPRARKIGDGRQQREHQYRRRSIATAFRLHAVARHYRDRMEHELERESARADREGWVR